MKSKRIEYSKRVILLSSVEIKLA